MFKKKDSSKAPATQSRDVFDKALDWESSRIESSEKSERRAWRIAYTAGVVALCAIVSLLALAPLKETQPYLLRVDNNTGAVDMVSVLKTKEDTYGEVVDKYWVARYVEARETYDWQTLQRDYDLVNILSDRATASAYNATFGGEKGKDQVLGNSVRTHVEILSVVPNNPSTATVRVRTKTSRADGGGIPSYETWVVTLAYTYLSTSSMKEEYRLMNPLGFQVTSYRIDPELVRSGS